MRLYHISFSYKEVPRFTYEFFYPFGNYKSDYLNEYAIFVQSPSEYYYSELLGSFILSPGEAWEVYISVLRNQQCPDCFRDESVILEAIPDHKATLEEQFKSDYIKANYNVCNYYNNTI